MNSTFLSECFSSFEMLRHDIKGLFITNHAKRLYTISIEMNNKPQQVNPQFFAIIGLGAFSQHGNRYSLLAKFLIVIDKLDIAMVKQAKFEFSATLCTINASLQVRPLWRNTRTDDVSNTNSYYPTSKFTRSTRPSGCQTTGSTARSHSDEKMTGEGILPSPRSELNILAPPLLA